MTEKTSNDSCVYEGKEYSDGALVCQNGWIMRCADGRWVNTQAPCGETAGKTFESCDGKITSGGEEVFSESVSEAKFCVDSSGHPSTQSPTITITNRNIRIEHIKQGVCATLNDTYLKGSGGVYQLQAGTQTVQPGTYSHVVEGSISVGGPCTGACLISRVYYS